MLIPDTKAIKESTPPARNNGLSKGIRDREASLRLSMGNGRLDDSLHGSTVPTPAGRGTRRASLYGHSTKSNRNNLRGGGYRGDVGRAYEQRNNSTKEKGIWYLFVMYSVANNFIRNTDGRRLWNC